jgi:hypothetical protein
VSDRVSIVSVYRDAKASVVAAGFLDEIHWSATLAKRKVVESEFLREVAWVVLCCGLGKHSPCKIFVHIAMFLRLGERIGYSGECRPMHWNGSFGFWEYK